MPDLDAALDDDIGDELLRLIFTACHPAAVARGPRGAGAAHDLRPDHGGDRPRLPGAGADDRPAHRARQANAFGIGPRLRDPAAARSCPQRLASVLEVVYLIFNEGYTAARGEDWLRPQLCDEALRMGRVLTAIAPQEPEAHGLLALMELNASRTAARTDAAGEPILLLDQNRARWDQLQIRRGMLALGAGARTRRRRRLLRAAGGDRRLPRPGARPPSETDWPRIADLYAQLAALVPSPVIELNRAVAVGMAEGPQAGACDRGAPRCTSPR